MAGRRMIILVKLGSIKRSLNVIGKIGSRIDYEFFEIWFWGRGGGRWARWFRVNSYRVAPSI